jgi:dTDP-4-dehydrorhamnose 3,5-epimerase-like enzyme
LQWRAVKLTEDIPLSLYVGKGYAHGYLTLNRNTIVLYNISLYKKNSAIFEIPKL